MTAGIPLRNQQLIDQLYHPPTKERIFPSYRNSIISPNYLHQADVLYLPEDPSGYKYLLTVIDVHNSLAGAYPLKDMNSSTIINGFEEIYGTYHRLLSYPKVLQVDNQFDNRFIQKWARDRVIRLKVNLPYRSRQNAHVERLNQEIGEILFKIMLDEEISTGRQSKEWVRYYQTIIDYHNNIIIPTLTRGKRPMRNPEDTVIKFNKKSKYIIRNGSVVRRLLDSPVEYLGNRLSGRFRKTDIKWSKELYIVIETIMIPGNPPLYKIMSQTDRQPVRALFTNEQLQIV